MKIEKLIVLMALMVTLFAGCATTAPQMITSSNNQSLVMHKDLGTFARVNAPADGQANWERVGEAKKAKTTIVQRIVSRWGQGSDAYGYRGGYGNVVRQWYPAGPSFRGSVSAHAGFHKDRRGSSSHSGFDVDVHEHDNRSVNPRRSRKQPTYRSTRSSRR
ncbi:hypothetical protein COB55_02970 [Candidatus Wolfebacteria bacterium]|nr:MAG: hypothetical protein COB55_02970 [Candidatus Wolfebacteria bacterium]